MPVGEWGKIVVIFGVNNGSSRHTDNRKKDILVLGEGSTDRLHDNPETVEAKYSVNISQEIKLV